MARGLPISVRAMVSICCSPPEVRPAGRRAQHGEVRKQREQPLGRPGRRAVARRLAADLEVLLHRQVGETRAAPRARSRGPGARSGAAAGRRSSWPAKRIRPRVGRTRPMMLFSVVDLPAPLRPSSATTSPRADLEAHVVQDVRAAVVAVQAGDLKHRRGLRSGGAPGPSARRRDRSPAPAGRRAPRRACRSATSRPRFITMIRSALANTTSMSCSVNSTARSRSRTIVAGQRHQRDALARRHAGGRLVHQQEPRLVRQRDRQLDPLEIAVGQHAAGALGLVRDPDPREQRQRLVAIQAGRARPEARACAGDARSAPAARSRARSSSRRSG